MKSVNIYEINNIFFYEKIMKQIYKNNIHLKFIDQYLVKFYQMFKLAHQKDCSMKFTSFLVAERLQYIGIIYLNHYNSKLNIDEDTFIKLIDQSMYVFLSVFVKSLHFVKLISRKKVFEKMVDFQDNQDLFLVSLTTMTQL